MNPSGPRAPDQLYRSPRATPPTLGKFLIVGGSGVLVNSSALLVLHQWAGLPLLIAAPLAIELSIVNNFIWNDRWTFRYRSRTWELLGRFVQFNAVSVLGVLITTGTTLLLVEGMGLQYLVSNLCGIGLAALCNFFANLHWTWRTPSRSSADCDLGPKPACRPNFFQRIAPRARLATWVSGRGLRCRDV